MRYCFVILSLFICRFSFACDGCNVATGIINSDPVNYASFKYRNLYLSGVETPFFRHTGDGGALAETYISYELIVKHFIYKKLYLQGFLSGSETKVLSAEIDQNIIGFEDPILLMGYQSFNTYKAWQFNYNFFGGFDFGIGAYRSSISPEYSPGSKSSDFILGTELTARFLKWGIINRSNIKKSFENNENYRFGNVYNSGLVFAFYHEKEKLLYVPNAGVSYEFDGIDFNNGRKAIYTNGNVVFMDLGLNLLFNEKLLIGGKYQFPLLKDIDGWESLKFDSFEVDIAYIFGK